jgi:hypothetical protein
VGTNLRRWRRTWKRDREAAWAMARRTIRVRTRSLLGFG